MSGEGKLVCVTGASGYIASWVVKLLLLRGYSVNATVRHLNDPKKVEHLMALEGAKERLKLFRAELTEEGSFDPAVAGCVGVFHTASPCVFFPDDPQGELVDPAVQGTINVLSSCTKVSSIKRVVLTSSISSMLFTGGPISLNTMVDETWFSDPDYCRKHQKWYPLSKISAEEAAWKYAKDKGIDLVTICPGWVIGPLLQPTMNATSYIIFNLIGAETYQDITYGYVHVKDVADAHIRAFEMESANGRYCIVEREIHFSNITNIMREACPNLPLPNKCVSGEPYVPECKFSRQRAESLGIEFIPIEVTLKEMIQSFKEKQFIKI
ncbi:hypothetical protein V2J09_012715 [Rumex salicifolius]